MDTIMQKERRIIAEHKKREFHINGSLYMEAFWPPKEKFHYRFVVKGDIEKGIEPLYTELFEADNDGCWDLDRFCKENNAVLFLLYFTLIKL